MAIKIKGLDRLLVGLKELPEKIQKNVDAELKAGAFKIATTAKSLAPVDESKLKNSISTETKTKGKYSVFTNLFYAPYIEFGTKGKAKIPAGLQDVAAEFQGKRGGGNWEQFVESLTQWVKRKGIAGRYSVKTRRRLGSKATKRSEDEKVARLIAMSIMKKGINPHPFFYKSLQINERQILTNLARAIFVKL